jgi:lysophospholipase L1-like esterase
MKNFTLLLISICFVLLSCEFGIRFWKKAWPFERPLRVQKHLTARDLPLRWRFSPSDTRNSLGLRNREVVKKKAGTYRILFLGDSLVWSGETNSGKLYTEVLERRLNSLSQNNSDAYEVINAGVPGYTTYQELEFLKIYGLDMEPDLVILGFVFNDLYKYLHRPTKHGLLDIDPTQSLHQFDTNSPLGSIFARSYLAHQIVMRCKILWSLILKKPLYPFEQRGDFYLAWKNYGWLNVQKLIGEMQDLLAKKGILFLVIVFPVSDQVNAQYLSLDKEFVLFPQKMIETICNKYKIPVLDITDSIYINGGVNLFRDYLHLNAKGNDVVAYELEVYLLNNIINSKMR